MRISVSFIVAIMVAFTAGCGGHPQEENYGKNERAQSLIDQGFYNEAIYSLNSQIKADPDDPSTRLLLASALAARNGIFLVRFANFARTVTVNAASASGRDLNGLELLSWQIDLVFIAINAILTVDSAAGLADIEQGISALNVAGLSGGGYLYRALLKLVAFKYRVMHDYRFAIDAQCQVSPKDVSNWFTNVGDDLLDLLSDIEASVSSPAEQAKIQSLEADVKSVTGKLQAMIGQKKNKDKATVNMPKFFKKIYSGCP